MMRSLFLLLLLCCNVLPAAGSESELDSTAETVTWPGLDRGTRFLAVVDAAIRSDVDVPFVLRVQYDYRSSSGGVIPAGSRVFGHLAHVSHDGFVQIHVDSLLLNAVGMVGIDGTVISLSGGPLKGGVHQRKRLAKVLGRAAIGKGYAAAHAAMGQRFGGRSYRRFLLRHSLADFVGGVSDDFLHDASRERRRVVVVPASTQVMIVLRQAVRPAQFRR